MFQETQNEHLKQAVKQKPGAGRKRKLDADNPGLKAAVMALNIGALPNMAVSVCNVTNAEAGLDVTVCRNTLIDTIKDYSDFEKRATPRSKTGKKDPQSDWAIARSATAEQMLIQVKDGKLVYAGTK